MEKMNNCEDFEELIIPFLDNELNSEQTESVKKHLITCPKCNNLMKEHKLLWEMLDELPGAKTANLLPRIKSTLIRTERRNRFIRWSTAAAALLIFSTVLIGTFLYRQKEQSPDPELLANLEVVEDYASLSKVGGEDLVVNPELLNVTFELSRKTLGEGF